MSKAADADVFLQALLAATGELKPDVFDVPFSIGEPGYTIYRERAYCYELYHHLRLRWDPGTYTLNGELSKAAHPLFKGLEKTPDFLVHIPRTMESNLVIVEVKSATGLGKSARPVEADLFKLTEFVREKQYERGIYLIYGDDGDPIKKVRKVAKAWKALKSGRSFERVHLLWHARSGASANEVGWE